MDTQYIYDKEGNPVFAVLHIDDYIELFPEEAAKSLHVHFGATPQNISQASSKRNLIEES